MDDFDRQCKAIHEYNEPLLDDFSIWLAESGLSRKTVKTHVSNIDFFSIYLVDDEPLQRLDEADETDITMFLGDWFHRKAMWSSVESTKSNIASFKKFFKWMGETGKASEEVVDEVLTMLKEERDELLAAAEDGGGGWLDLF